MNYLNKMYGAKSSTKTESTSDKNPNRVAGGLRAQGVDSVEMIGEDGSVQNLPTQKYVQSLEEQLKQQRSAIQVLERKLARQDATIQSITSALNRP